jgi:hypothetical protein
MNPDVLTVLEKSLAQEVEQRDIGRIWANEEW